MRDAFGEVSGVWCGMFLRGGGGAPEVREEMVDGILSLSEALSDSESEIEQIMNVSNSIKSEIKLEHNSCIPSVETPSEHPDSPSCFGSVMIVTGRGPMGLCKRKSRLEQCG